MAVEAFYSDYIESKEIYAEMKRLFYKEYKEMKLELKKQNRDLEIGNFCKIFELSPRIAIFVMHCYLRSINS